MSRVSVSLWDFVLPRCALRVLRRGSGVHGNARWMTERETKRFLSEKHEGLVFAPGRRLSWEESFRNLMLAAPTGSGKTTRFIIPNVLEAQGSVVVTDPSGEIYRATSGYMARRGFAVQALQPADAGRSLSFNPLAYARGKEELQRLAGILARSGSSEHDTFWIKGAADILGILLQTLARAEDPRQAHLGNVWRLLNDFGMEGEGIRDFVCRYADDDTMAEFRGFVSQDAKVIANMVSSARTGVDLWKSPEVRKLTASDTVDIRGIRDRRTVIYLIVPEHKVRRFALLLNLFYTACFEHCLESGDEGLPVLFLLEECGNIGRIDNFPSIITTLRRRRCATTVILQDPAQLEELYGQSGARAIIAGGCANKLFFAGTDAVAARYVEDALGAETAWETPYGGTSEQARTIGKPLLRRDEIRMMTGDQGILISGRERPALLRVPPYYRVRKWREWCDLAPHPLPGAVAREEAVYGTGAAG